MQDRPADAGRGAAAGGLAGGCNACELDRPLIVLVRHPPVDAAGRCYGRTDLTLAEQDSVAPLAARLAALGGIVWTSPSQRCRCVAEAAGPHRVDARLMELDFGAWEGLKWDDVPRSALDDWAADPWGFAPPGGETGAALVSRVRAFSDDLPPGTQIVVSHGGPLKVLLALIERRQVDLLAPPPALGSVTIVAKPVPSPIPSPPRAG